MRLPSTHSIKHSVLIKKKNQPSQQLNRATEITSTYCFSNYDLNSKKKHIFFFTLNLSKTVPLFNMTEIKQAKKTKTREALCSCFVTKQMQIKLALTSFQLIKQEFNASLVLKYNSNKNSTRLSRTKQRQEACFDECFNKYALVIIHRKL